MSDFPKLTTVIGGVSSGKSSFAERLVTASGLNKIYLATAEARDEEMTARVERHIKQRGPGWTTIEEPFDIARPLAALSSGDICLLDCATMWLSNMVERGQDRSALSRFTDAIGNTPAKIVVVTNELGLGGIASNELARRFADMQGRLNIELTANADLAVAVIAGQPFLLKGQLPDFEA